MTLSTKNIPVASILGVLAALVGAVVTIVHPVSLPYPSYLKDLGYFLTGAGALGIARTKAGKGTGSFVAVLDDLPWETIIGGIAILAGAVIAIVHPNTLSFNQLLQDGGVLLLGTGVFGINRAMAGKSIAL